MPATEEWAGGRQVGFGTLRSSVCTEMGLSVMLLGNCHLCPVLSSAASSGLRSRQKCMSQRYTCLLGDRPWRRGGAERHLRCHLPGVPACLGGHWQGPGRLSRLASPLLLVPVSLLRPQPGPVRVGQSCQEEAAGGESAQTGPRIPDPPFR